MSPTTYTWTGSNGGTFDNLSNWSVDGIPTEPGVSSANNTDYSTDSFVFNATAPTTAFYVTGDGAYDLTIDSANFTVAASVANGQLTIQDGIFVQAGTLDIGDTGEVSFQVATTGEVQSFVLDSVLQGSGLFDPSDPTITGTGTIVAETEARSSTLTFYNSVGATVADTLALDVQSGAQASLFASVGSGVTVNVASGGTVEFNSALLGPNSVATGAVVNDSAGASILIDDVPDFHGTVSGLGEAIGQNGTGAAASNFLDLTAVNISNATITYNNGVITISDDADLQSGTIVVSGNPGPYINYVADSSGVGTDVFFSDTVCFVAGTDILTPNGTVAVESLSAGDQVIAVVDGQHVAQPIKWVGYRKLDLSRHAETAGLGPVRIKRGAMAEGLPARDLLVSPPHCMFIDGKLVPAKLLVNDMTIVRDTTLKVVEYYHIELDRHAVIIAEGVESESYLDTGNRAFFSNAGLALILHPEFHVNAGLRCWETDACAPLAVSPAAVMPVWRQLADRAVALGYVPPTRATTTETDLHLIADGRRIDTIAVSGKVHSFMIPAGVTSLVLASRATAPSTLTAYHDDPRQLGVAVSRVTLRGQAGRVEFAADHPALAQGWFGPEQADRAMWRWTNGHAALPTGAVSGPVIVEITLAATATYLIEEARAEGRLAA